MSNLAPSPSRAFGRKRLCGGLRPVLVPYRASDKAKVASLERGGVHRQRGQTAVEFALVLPLFIMMLAGMIQFGVLFYFYAGLVQGAQEAVRYGAILGNLTDSAIQQRAADAVLAATGGVVSIPPATVQVSSTCSPSSNIVVPAANRSRGNVLTVRVPLTYGLSIPFFPAAQVSLAGQASTVIEQSAVQAAC